jgi:hypothetical protein
VGRVQVLPNTVKREGLVAWDLRQSYPSPHAYIVLVRVQTARCLSCIKHNQFTYQDISDVDNLAGYKHTVSR